MFQAGWFAEFRDFVAGCTTWSPQDKAMVYPSKPAKLPAVVASPLVQVLCHMDMLVGGDILHPFTSLT
jgi:hypothetical protein